MHHRLIYRLAVSTFILLFLTMSFSLRAQTEEDEDSAVMAETPVAEFAQDDEYNNSQYQQQPPSLRNVAPKVVDSLKRDADFAYANDPSYWVKEEPKPRRGFWDSFDGFFAQSTVRTIFYILLIAFILFVIYRIIIANNLFYSGKKGIIADDGEEEVISDENIDEKINKAINERDYRSAVRFLYLKSLGLLNDRGWIRYHAQATNHDYIYQLKEQPVAGDFRFLTQVYDYVWYGEFAVNDDQFGRLHGDFKRFYQAIR